MTVETYEMYKVLLSNGNSVDLPANSVEEAFMMADGIFAIRPIKAAPHEDGRKWYQVSPGKYSPVEVNKKEV